MLRLLAPVVLVVLTSVAPVSAGGWEPDCYEVEVTVPPEKPGVTFCP